MRIGVIISLILLGGFFIIFQEKPLVTKRIIIPKGASLKEIAETLKDEGLIKNQSLFLILAKIFGASRSLKAGEYELNNKMGMTEIIKILKGGKIIVHKILIPPGYTLNDIANLLEKHFLVNRERFLTLSHDPSFIKKVLSINTPSLEGYLFPDTYFLHKGMSEEEIIGLMTRRFKEVVSKEININDNMLHQVITLASIIEKEAKIKEEYPIISAVFHNRLKNNMRLESCASVLYALGKKREHLSIEDTKITSPYNTYLRLGLPPTPICNPGIWAIKAALNPKDVDYLYFVSKGDGSHIFSKTGHSHIFFKNLLTEKGKQEQSRKSNLK